MRTLKEVRLERGLNQTAVAKRIGVSVPQLSLYESGADAPMVEDMVNAELEFDEPMNWASNETISIDARASIILAFNVLTQRYPLQSVLNFLSRCIKIDQKTGRPDRLINFFASRMKHKEEVEPMLPSFVRKYSSNSNQ